MGTWICQVSRLLSQGPHFAWIQLCIIICAVSVACVYICTGCSYKYSQSSWQLKGKHLKKWFMVTLYPDQIVPSQIFQHYYRLFHRYIGYRFSAVLFNNRRLREIFKNILCTPGWLWSIFMVFLTLLFENGSFLNFPCFFFSFGKLW